jgi:hypothetical protein
LISLLADKAAAADAKIPNSLEGDPSALIRMRRSRVLPARSREIEIPTFRKNVAVRVRRLLNARGLAGQSFDLAARSPASSARAGKSSEAFPVQKRSMAPRRD